MSPKLLSTRLGDSTEQVLLEQIARILGQPFKGVRVGVGDDAALLTAAGPCMVLSADMLIENVDFDLSWAPWAAVGHKAAAANLSDLAAMAAQPRGLLLSLGLRQNDRVGDVLALVHAVDKLGRRFGAPLVGGDLSRTQGPLVVAITAVGQTTHPLRRHQGRVGDIIMVSGKLGAAALGLACLQRGVISHFAKAQLAPMPRVALAQALMSAGVVRSGADISDGLVRDVLHVARPNLGVRLFAQKLPLPRGGQALAERLGMNMAHLALAGGEDFELVLAVPKTLAKQALAIAARQKLMLTAVGDIVAGGGLTVVDGPAHLTAFDHFAGQKIKATPSV